MNEARIDTRDSARPAESLRDREARNGAQAGSVAGVAGRSGSVGPAASDAGGERLARDAILTVGTRFLLAAIIILSDLILARVLGPDAKGRFLLVVTFSQLAALVIGVGLDRALGVSIAASPSPAVWANALAWSLIVGGAGALGVLALAGIGAGGTAQGPLTLVLPNLSGPELAFAAIAIPGELLVGFGLYAFLGRGQIGRYNVLRTLRRLVLLVTLLGALLVARLDLGLVLVLNLVALVVCGAMALGSAARERLLGFRPSLSLLASQLSFGARSVVGVFAERLLFRADAFLINFFLGPLAAGVYSVSAALSETLWYIPMALGTVVFSRAAASGGAAPAVAAVARVTTALAVAMAVPVFLLAPLAIGLVYGERFAGAADPLRALLPGVVAYSLVAVLSQYVVARGAPGRFTAVVLLSLGLDLVLNVLLIPRLGITGASIASSVSYTVSAVLTMLLFQRIAGMPLRAILVPTRRDAVEAAHRVATAVRLVRRTVRRGPPAP